jgi:hypothetical protein
MLVAEQGGQTMLARIGMMRALYPGELCRRRAGSARKNTGLPDHASVDRRMAASCFDRHRDARRPDRLSQHHRWRHTLEQRRSSPAMPSACSSRTRCPTRCAFFHINALSSSVGFKVDFDMAAE